MSLPGRSATDQQIDRLGQIERELEPAVLKDMASARVIELDVKFDSLILEMTGSTLDAADHVAVFARTKETGD